MAKTECMSLKVSPEEKSMIQRLAADKDWTVSKFLYNTLMDALLQQQKKEEQ